MKGNLSDFIDCSKMYKKRFLRIGLNLIYFRKKVVRWSRIIVTSDVMHIIILNSNNQTSVYHCRHHQLCSSKHSEGNYLQQFLKRYLYILIRSNFFLYLANFIKNKCMILRNFISRFILILLHYLKGFQTFNKISLIFITLVKIVM